MTNHLAQLRQSFRHFSGKPAVRRSAIGLAVLVILIGLFGYFVLPGIIKSEAEKVISEKLHRQTTIGQVDVNPYALRVTLHDFKIMEPEGKTVFASFDALTVNVSYQSLFRLAPVVGELKLSAPYIHLVRKDATHYNIDDLIALINSQPPSPTPARFSVFNIQIDKGHIAFDDQPAQTVHQVTDLRLGIPFISSLPSQVEVFVEPLLSATVNGSPFLLKGKAHPFADSRDAIIDLNLDNLELSSYLKYLPGTPHFKLPSARLDLHLSANFHQQKDKPALLLSGDVKLKSVQINDPSGKSIVKLPELAVSLHNADVLSNRFEVARIAINGLEADLARNAHGTYNFDNLLSLPPAPPVAKSATPAAAPSKTVAGFTIALNELAIDNAALRYADAQVARPITAGADHVDLTVRNIALDTGKKTVSIDNVTSNRANFSLQQGKPRSAAETAAAPSTTEKTAAKPDAGKADAPYTVTINKLGIDNWAAQLEDRSLPHPAVTVIAPLHLALQNLSTRAGARGQIDLKAAVNKSGQLAVNGNIGLAPLHTDLALDLKSVDILQLQPYFTAQVNILLTRANLSGKGQLLLDQDKKGALSGGFKGDLTLGDVATIDKLSSNDFLRWKSLYFGGVDVRLAPFALNIDQIALNNFFARIIIDPTGRINLQDVKRSATVGSKSVTEEGHVPVAASTVIATNTAVLPTPAKPASAMPPIKIRKLTLQGGQVRFTDNFVKPNYTANLMKFGGAVTGLSSDAKTSANVDLKGLVNSAPLAVAGSINPLKGDLTMDIKANVQGMELAPLSPYSGRYIGYGIEKGKLSFDVAYKVENRVLTAQNRLVLEQLTLGDKIESPTATTLPVQFALSLLKDRNGVIDINLPIGGSLDDPQFSVGGVIVKVIVNLLTKAVTAPFTLLSSLFGGGEELSVLEFDPGRAAISEQGEAKLKSVGKMLNDRPALKLEITGRSDPESDREGLKRASIDRKVRALKLKDMVARGISADASDVSITPQEYPALLKRVYKDADFPKQRNLIGLQKDLPVDEMEKLLTANATVTDDDLTALGNRRAQAAKDWLITTGQVPPERIFLLASKSGASTTSGEGTAAKPNRVDFSLK